MSNSKAKQRWRLFKAQKGLCIYCERPTWFNGRESKIDASKRLGFWNGVSATHKLRYRMATFEHLIPKSQGGKQQDNGVMACQLCNSSRGVRDPIEFKAEVMRLIEKGKWDL